MVWKMVLRRKTTQKANSHYKFVEFIRILSWCNLSAFSHIPAGPNLRLIDLIYKMRERSKRIGKN
jgi:hypothetical protein